MEQDTDICALDSDELERFLQEAVNPAVPIGDFYCALDRLTALSAMRAPAAEGTDGDHTPSPGPTGN